MLNTEDFLCTLIHDEKGLPFVKFRVCDHDHLNLLHIDLLKAINNMCVNLTINEEFELLDRLNGDILA